MKNKIKNITGNVLLGATMVFVVYLSFLFLNLKQGAEHEG